MKGQLYIVPENGRWWLKRSDKSIAMSKTGYKSRRSAEVALWRFNQSKEVFVAEYKAKREMSNELRHFKNI